MDVDRSDDEVELARTPVPTSSSAAIVAQAMRGEQLAAFDALCGRVSVDELIELASSEYGVAWTLIPRSALPRDHRLAILHAAARMYRYDGTAMHLDGDLFAVLVSCLAEGNGRWAGHAARMWQQLVVHTGEVATVWPQARALMDRHGDAARAEVFVIAAIATIASCAGAPEADQLWTDVLAHPSLGDSAAQRWELELDWARCHLMLGGGEPVRALTVMRRVRRGFADIAGQTAELVWTNATLELACGLTWLGRPADALAVIEESLRRVEPGGELEVWIRGMGAYAAAAIGDDSGVDAGVASVDRASTDTAGLCLRATIPARLVQAGRLGRSDELTQQWEAAFELEQSRPFDPDLRAAWRVHALEAAIVAGARDMAEAWLGDLEAVLASSPCELPVHGLRRDHAAAALQPPVDAAASLESLERRARVLGVTLPDLAPAGSATIASAAATPPVSIQLFGAFHLASGGEPVDERLWAGRRQARILLALLLAHGGRASVEAVAEILWDGIEPLAARRRIAPLCNSIRAVLAAGRTTAADRALVTRGGMISLRLHRDDRCDLLTLRDAVARVQREPARSRDAALEGIAIAQRPPLADLGSDLGAAAIRSELEAEAATSTVRLAAAWDGQHAPAEVVTAVRRAFDADPANLVACERLMRLLRDRGDVAGASAVFHSARAHLDRELGLAPPLDLVRLHSVIIAQDDSAAAASTSAS